MTFRVLFLAGILGLPAFAETRLPARLDNNYRGSDQDGFVLQQDRVRLLVHQAQIEISARLGLLQYKEGFQFPMTIRYDDGAPQGLENTLAYVRLGRSPQGFAQELVINVTESHQVTTDFDKIFYHEMTHAVLNDAVGGDAAIRIPHWVQEGLAQWVSGEGRERVKATAGQIRRSQAGMLVRDLEGPYQAIAYPQYFLAIQYLHEKHSVNSVETLVRNLIAGQAPHVALEDATGMTWDHFQQAVKDWSLIQFQDQALPDF